MILLSVIIPVFNEESTILSLLQKVCSVSLPDGVERDIVVVDDCSEDRTWEILNDFLHSNPDLPVRIFRHEKNKGKGAALRRAIREAKGHYIVIQDADLEYDPSEFSILLKPVLDGYADVVYGSRFMGGSPHRILFFWHSVGNKFLTFLSNMLTNLNLTDMETCYKLFRADILKSLDLKENRFGFEPEVTARIARFPGVRIYEVGISYYGRTYNEGKKINWRDGFSAIWCILKYNIWARQRFKNMQQ